MINKEIVDNILDVVPAQAKACYTGQSILAYCPDPTFTYNELNLWEQETDIDIFAYTTQSQASIVQAFISDGWTPPNSIEQFKADRIRFNEPSNKFNLQTVHLVKPDMPEVNISWRKDEKDCIDVIKVFDMDYLCVSMDIKTRSFADLRGADHRVAHVNKFNARFDPYESEPSYWYRQFERCPKGWSRGIDTRPVAQQYVDWIKRSLEIGDKSIHSKTAQYAAKFMEEAIAPFIELGMDEAEARQIYKLVKQEKPSWESTKIKHEAMLYKINAWLESVKDI